MISRFFDYNCLVTYLGNLDEDDFGSSLKKVLGDGNKFIPLIKSDVSLAEYNGYMLLKIELIYFVKESILSPEEKEEFIKKMKVDIKNAINAELKKQKVIFTVEDN